MSTQTLDQVDGRQKLRLLRLLIAVAVYVPCALMLAMVSWQGFLPPWFAPVWTGIFAGTNVLFFALIKNDVNLRFRDPSMTMAQMAVAIGAVAFILYHAGAIRGGLLMLLLVILLLIADIDYFKQVNDTHGHLVGDQVIKAVAVSTQDILRKADYMARYGGEEFVLIIAANDLARRLPPANASGRTCNGCAFPSCNHRA